jgi:DDE superfamily endonuclease
MELTQSFLDLLQYFSGVFTAPTFQTFLQICNGWVLSHRHRFITDIIFSGGNVAKGHWARFHRFFSDAAWNLDTLNMCLAMLVVRILAPTGTILLAVDDTLCRKRGLTIFGAGMHHDPLISSKAKPLVSWGHDWVVLSILIVHPFWAPTKVFALPIAERLYKNRQGLAKGKNKKITSANSTTPSQRRAKKTKPPADHRTRPQLAVELLTLAASWFPERDLLVSGDSAYGGKSVLSKLPANVQLISRVHSKGVLYEPPPAQPDSTPPGPQRRRGRPRKRGARLPGLSDWANDTTKPWTDLAFDQFGLHATLQVKSQQALYYKAGGSRLLTIVLTRDLLGKRPEQMFYCTNLAWDVRQILATYAYRWAIECTFENSKQYMGLEDPANRVRLAVSRTAPMALFLYSMIVVWFHTLGHRLLQFPHRPWYKHKKEPSFADMLTTLRQRSYDDISATLPWQRTQHKTLFARITELLSRTG